MTGIRKRSACPLPPAELGPFIRNGGEKAIRKALQVIEDNSIVKIIAVDIPEDTVIFGAPYLSELEKLVEAEVAMGSCLIIEDEF